MAPKKRSPASMISHEDYCGPGGAGLPGGGGLAWAGGGGGGGGLAWVGGGGLAWAASSAVPKPSMTRTRAMVRVTACIERSMDVERSTPLTPVAHLDTSTLRPNRNRIAA